MKKKPVPKVKLRGVVDVAVQRGVVYGLRQATKHLDEGVMPVTEDLVFHVTLGVMQALGEVVELDAGSS